MGDDRLQPGWCKLTVPNDLSYVPVAQSFVAGVASQIGFGQDDLHRIELAVEEASANVIEHAFAPGEDAHFDVLCQRVPHGIEIRIHDDGLPYDPTLAPDYDPSADLDGQDGLGLGGFLMKHLMDEYEFCNLGAKGKETRLVKYLDSPNVVDEEPGKEPETPEPPSSRPVETTEFAIRAMRPEEAIEVARCVYDAYGYSYANEHVYYPERVAAMNQSGYLLSAVASAESGEIGGHAALIFHEDFAPELGIAVVKREFRGCRLATRIGEFLVEQAISRSIQALQVKQVTVHPYTQKFCQKQGYLDCGFLLAHSPKTLSFKGIADDLGQRNSDVVGMNYLQPPGPVSIYPPERHADMIQKLYASLGVPAAEGTPVDTSRRRPVGHDGASSESATVMSCSVNSMRALAEIRISRYGDDVLRIVKQELRRLRLEEVRVIEMFLALGDPMTREVVPALEELGFFFTGIMPHTSTGDALIMQYFNGAEVDYDAMHVVSDVARELLDYIKQNDPYLV